MLLADREVLRLADALSQTQEEELDCESFLLGVAALAEGAEGGGMLQHARLCACCAEELAALRDGVQPSGGGLSSPVGGQDGRTGSDGCSDGDADGVRSR